MVNLEYSFTELEKLDIIKKHVIIYNLSLEYIKTNKYIEAIELLYKIVNCIDIREFLLLSAKPPVNKALFLDALFNLGTLLKMKGEESVNIKISEMHKNNSTRTNIIDTKLSTYELSIFNKSLHYFYMILAIDFENSKSMEQIKHIFSQLTYLSQGDLNKSLDFLKQALLYNPTDASLHYNLGHIYQRLNNLSDSLIHYKISLKLNEQLSESFILYKIRTKLNEQNNDNDNDNVNEIKKLALNNYNGIASVYRGIKKWPESLFYLLKAHEIDSLDPDINNQLGVVYSEMRETEMGEKHYKLAIENYDKTFISTDSKFLLSEIYLNYGHLQSYNGENNKCIDCYNQSLKNVPKFVLPFQNKIMNMNYIFDQLEDKMYITNQHKLINKLLSKNPNPYVFNKEFFNSIKINIGIISGDFIEHPVSFFISTFLKNFDFTKFNVTCYSECIIDTSVFNKNLKFETIKYKSGKQVSDIIYNNNTHILLDLTGHTAFNRLDVFAYKPAPIQISYIGYPFTTGLNEIDYRITDSICDGDFSISQKFYTEKLIALKNCFLCYDTDISQLPTLKCSPRVKNKNEIIIACFNRINKITDTVIIEFNKILLANKNIKFLFKTKALINIRIKQNFINKFSKNVQDRIIIIDCTLTHLQHIETYNQADLAIDTWPYSGTTTTCEALSMGVPVISLYDNIWYYHAQNVSCSILKNSDLDFYICNNTEEIIDKIKILEEKPIEYWKTSKEIIRKKFLNGLVCNKIEYLKNLQNLFIDLLKKHSSF